MKKDSLTTSYVKIFLDSIELPLQIGIYDHEQNVAQRVVVDLEVYTEPEYLGKTGVEGFIDYDLYYHEITSWSKRSQVRLIEDYLKELVDLCFKDRRISACRACIRKLDIFGQDQGAGVEVFVGREDWR